MIAQGYMPPFTQVAGLGQTTLFQAGQIALSVDGSWMIGAYTSTEGVDVGFAPQPEGPEGSWSVFNGLADSIWEGTDHPEEAWEWVKFLASIECQRIVGEHAVVFPAIPEAADVALETLEGRGIDASAFMSYPRRTTPSCTRSPTTRRS